jgi:hypothetical protein
MLQLPAGLSASGYRSYPRVGRDDGWAAAGRPPTMRAVDRRTGHTSRCTGDGILMTPSCGCDTGVMLQRRARLAVESLRMVGAAAANTAKSSSPTRGSATSPTSQIHRTRWARRTGSGTRRRRSARGTGVIHGPPRTSTGQRVTLTRQRVPPAMEPGSRSACRRDVVRPIWELARIVLVEHGDGNAAPEHALFGGVGPG